MLSLSQSHAVTLLLHCFTAALLVVSSCVVIHQKNFESVHPGTNSSAAQLPLTVTATVFGAIYVQGVMMYLVLFIIQTLHNGDGVPTDLPFISCTVNNGKQAENYSKLMCELKLNYVIAKFSYIRNVSIIRKLYIHTKYKVYSLRCVSALG